MLGIAKECDRALYEGGVGPRWPIAGHELRNLLDVRREHLHVTGDFDEHRAREAGSCDFIRFVDRGHNVFVLVDQEGGLGDAVENALLVELVKLIVTVRIATNTPGDDEEWHAVEVGLANAAHRMGHAGRGDNQ